MAPSCLGSMAQDETGSTLRGDRASVPNGFLAFGGSRRTRRPRRPEPRLPRPRCRPRIPRRANGGAVARDETGRIRRRPFAEWVLDGRAALARVGTRLSSAASPSLAARSGRRCSRRVWRSAWPASRSGRSTGASRLLASGQAIERSSSSKTTMPEEGLVRSTRTVSWSACATGVSRPLASRLGYRAQLAPRSGRRCPMGSGKDEPELALAQTAHSEVTERGSDRD